MFNRIFNDRFTSTIRYICSGIVLIYSATVYCVRYSVIPPCFTIMLDPAGDARYTGRIVDGTFERGLTLQWAQQLKKRLEQRYPAVEVLLTRRPGEVLYPLQQANFANRMHVDLFISLHLYQEVGLRPQMCLYRFGYNDTFMSHDNALLALYDYDQAHLFNLNTCAKWVDSIHDTLVESYNKLFDVHDVHTLPFKPLIGVLAPAIGIEASIKQAGDWQQFVDPLVTCIGAIVEAA